MRKKSLLLFAPLALAGACAELPDDTAPVATDESAILHGDEIDAAESGHVYFLLPRNKVCSGTLLRNRWVLSAAHCFEPDVVSDPSLGRVEMAGQSSPLMFVLPHPTLDVALVQLEYPLKMQGVASGYEARLRTESTTALAYETVDCIGYGNFTPTPDGFGANPGTLRHALVPIFTAFDSIFDTQRNNNGQIQSHGDSGGGCFFNGELAGVTSWPNGPDIDGVVTSISVPHVRGWIDENVPAVTAPFAPTDLSATPYEEGVHLHWASTPRALRYRLRMDGGQIIETLTGDSDNYYMPGLTPVSTHSFELCAINGAGQACSTIRATTLPRMPIPYAGPAVPASVTTTLLPLESNVIWPARVDWVAEVPNWASSFEVERRLVYPKTAAAWHLAKRVSASTTAATIRAVMTELYQFRVCAQNRVFRICSPATTRYAIGPTIPGNLLGDGAFEAQMVVPDYPGLALPWRSEGQTARVDRFGPTGQRILLDSGDGSRWRAVTQRVEVKPHTTYTLTAHVAHSMPVRAELGARTGNGEERIMFGRFGEDTREDLVKGVFDSGDETSVIVYVGFTTGGEHELLYLDDVSLDET